MEVETYFMVQEEISKKWHDYWLEKTLADARRTVERTKINFDRPIRIMKYTIEQVR